MRVAILGGGSAGYMAAAQLSHYLPDATLFHIFDSTLGTIGVGEGTTPVFVDWAQQLGIGFERLRETCDATEKQGIFFEGWGRGANYSHLFSSAEGRACHLSAARLVVLLAEVSRGQVIDARVSRVERHESGARIHLMDRAPLHVDFVIDARGFPAATLKREPSLSNQTLEHTRLECVPTDAALLYNTPVKATMRSATRAVARSHGWIFVIPLETRTAYGYVHGASLAQPSEVEADFRDFLAGEGLSAEGPFRLLRFPNFCVENFYDGVVMRVGNAASFIEPLEATALGVIAMQLRLATFLLLDRIGSFSRATSFDDSVPAVNTLLRDLVREVALFVSFHYAEGSIYDTPFWRHGRTCFARWRVHEPNQGLRFETFLERGRTHAPALANAASVSELDGMLGPQLAHEDTYGGFLDLSFAKVGHGIGFYAPDPR